MNNNNPLSWLVKIENNQNLRIIVTYNPLNNKLIFTGEYKQKNSIWIEFCNKTSSSDIDLDKIQKILEIIYKKLISRVETFEIINEQFKNIKLIGFEEENKEDNITDI